jgi:predicted enzyme related to lactoylglutathione lyase
MANNTICHLEISCKDCKKASEFYNSLFGWTMNFAMGDEYVLFQPEGAPGGGLSKAESINPGGGVIFYVEVDDIEAYLKKAVELGGQQAVAKTEISGHGWYGHFKDPDGNVIGLFTGNPTEQS